MDVSKMGRGRIVTAAGGAVLLLSLFLHWEDIAGLSAFDLFSGMDIIMVIVAVAALAYGLAPAAGMEMPVRDSAMIVFVLGVLVVGWALGNDLEDSSAGLGAWLGLFAALAIAVGAREPSWLTGGMSAGVSAGSPPPPSPPPPPPPPVATE
jgi:hypothetical protein